MRFAETEIAGAFIIDVEPAFDERGYFARTMCEKEFSEHGLISRFVQSSISRNIQRGIIRGLHYQVGPHEEAKLVRCSAGAIFDVIVDVRPQSRTFGRWAAFELSASNSSSLYIPPLVAHGFQTLTPHSDVFYQISGFHDATCARGIRWNDPSLNVNWPIISALLSVSDANLPDFNWANA